MHPVSSCVTKMSISPSSSKSAASAAVATEALRGTSPRATVSCRNVCSETSVKVPSPLLRYSCRASCAPRGTVPLPTVSFESKSRSPSWSASIGNKNAGVPSSAPASIRAWRGTGPCPTGSASCKRASVIPSRLDKRSSCVPSLSISANAAVCSPNSGNA